MQCINTHQLESTMIQDSEDEGIRIYSDAAWKKEGSAGSQGAAFTGVGIHMQLKENAGLTNINIQASRTPALSVLRAEAKAMLLATECAMKLQVTNPIFLTDNKMLAKAVASSKVDSEFIHWNTRDTLARILNNTRKLQARVSHIPRDVNNTAHDCAHKGLWMGQICGLLCQNIVLLFIKVRTNWEIMELATKQRRGQLCLLSIQHDR